MHRNRKSDEEINETYQTATGFSEEGPSYRLAHFESQNLIIWANFRLGTAEIGPISWAFTKLNLSIGFNFFHGDIGGSHGDPIHVVQHYLEPNFILRKHILMVPSDRPILHLNILDAQCARQDITY